MTKDALIQTVKNILCFINDHKTRVSHENAIPKNKARSIKKIIATYVNVLLRPLSKVAVLLLFSFFGFEVGLFQQ